MLPTNIDSLSRPGRFVRLVYLYPIGCVILILPTLFNLSGLFNYQFRFYNELTGSIAAGLWAVIWFALITVGYFALIKTSDRRHSKFLTFCSLLSVLCYLITVPFGSTDVFYYLGAARDEITRGVNPYLGGFSKINPFLTPTTSWSGPIMYPPLWLQINKILWTLSQNFGIIGQVYFYKIFFLTCHLLTAYIISKTRLDSSRVVQDDSRKVFLIYLLNPLLLFEFATNAHFDALMLLFVSLGLYLIIKNKTALGIAALSTAVLIKYTAILFMPFIILYVLVNSKNLTQLKKTIVDLTAGGFLSLVIAAVSFYPYWIHIGPKIFNGIATQSDWFVNSLFSTLYVPIIWLYQTATSETIPSISAKYLWVILIIVGATLVVVRILKTLRSRTSLAPTVFIELTTLLVVVFLTFTQRSYWPWYATWPFLTGILLGTENKIFRLSLIFTLSSFAFYLIYTFFGYNSTQTLDSLQVLYGLVVFVPVLFYLSRYSDNSEVFG